MYSPGDAKKSSSSPNHRAFAGWLDQAAKTRSGGAGKARSMVNEPCATVLSHVLLSLVLLGPAAVAAAVSAARMSPSRSSRRSQV